ncbi:uncharacterized protein E0L32_007254 [Thyridium curvatum]|uniref:DUF7907 domain-containing protein n=1 Tax=Thyridium curvatum TaxID=1093900 RepID=A0A507B469_9PEZI|nr:uncharacterized protein E0L32_007254 [Thyridium curvatum]TPX12139.1 hypothetical protein E0L32_007254 [Thyridium curvatum]
MKFSPSSLLLGLGAAGAMAQADVQDGPYALKIVDAEDASLNGLWVDACHSGAAIDTPCFSADAAGRELFYHNHTATGEAGPLIRYFNVDTGGDTPTRVPQPLSLTYVPSTNVANGLLSVGNTDPLNVAFDAAGKLFVRDYYDDSKFAAGERPQPGSYDLYHWQVCWNLASSYYYQSLAWVTSGNPHNPTCVAVNVTRVTPED